MADEIFKLERTTVRGADAADADLSDNGCVDRENAEAENRGFAAFSTSDASDQVDTLLDVSQGAEYLRISRSSVYKLIERRPIPTIRIGRFCASGRTSSTIRFAPWFTGSICSSPLAQNTCGTRPWKAADAG